VAQGLFRRIFAVHFSLFRTPRKQGNPPRFLRFALYLSCVCAQ
jgi:hypothetical protein